MHPKTRDVQVIGIPDARDGEGLCARVCLRDGGRDPRFLRGPDRPYKVPRYVKFVDGFPMTVTGKVQKFRMRRQMVNELGLNLQATA